MPESEDRSFQALAMPQMELLYRVARRLTRSAHEAEDLVQETYLRAYRAFDRFDLRAFGIRPWLLRILHNTFVNIRVKERSTKITFGIPHSADLPDTSIRSGMDSPPQLDFDLIDEEVKQAVDQLPTDFRVVLLLWATNEMSYQEIADALELPIGTVMSRLHRARGRLVQTLADYARDRGLVKSEKPE